MKQVTLKNKQTGNRVTLVKKTPTPINIRRVASAPVKKSYK